MTINRTEMTKWTEIEPPFGNRKDYIKNMCLAYCTHFYLIMENSWSLLFWQENFKFLKTQNVSPLAEMRLIPCIFSTQSLLSDPYYSHLFRFIWTYSSGCIPVLFIKGCRNLMQMTPCEHRLPSVSGGQWHTPQGAAH